MTNSQSPQTELADERLQFRPDHEGDFDEICAYYGDGMVHVETLSDQGCYVGFYWDDGRYCQWWIGCTGRGKLTYNHEDGNGPPPKFPSGYGTRPSPLVDTGEALREARFLCARLRDLDGAMSDPDAAARDFYGHVAPSLHRLEGYLAALSAPEPVEEK